jgi:hypothetical protein
MSSPPIASLLSISAGESGGMVEGPGGAGLGFLICGGWADAVPMIARQVSENASRRKQRGIRYGLLGRG